MAPLDGCYAKLARAEFHLLELGVRVRDYLSSAPFRIVGEYDDTAHEYVMKAEQAADYPPVPAELILIAGEVVHQLRSALDHLVWDLVVEQTGEPPPGTDDGFPIFSTADGYNRRAHQKVRGVSAAAADLIKVWQPYHLGDRAEEELIWAVQALNNTDKHRLIPVTLIYAFVGAVNMTVDNNPPVEILPWQEFMRDALVDGMEVARVAVADGDRATFNVPVGVDIAFERVGDLRNHPVNDLLSKMTHHVGRLIHSFRPEFAALRAF